MRGFASRCYRCGASFRSGEEVTQFAGALRHAAPCQSPAAEPKPAREQKPKRQKYRSKLDERYHAHLLAQLQAGEIEHVGYETVRLRLADGCWYKPDFWVIRKGKTEVHEAKGFMREAARLRLLIAAELHPYPFYLVRADGAGFAIESA